jgi:hypothetical protein
MVATKKLELYKVHSAGHAASKAQTLVEVKPAKYLAITGKGAPASAEFQDAISALYGAAFTIKMGKKQAGKDYQVCGLEGLWWGSQKDIDFVSQPPETWNWKLLIRVPEFVKEADLRKAISALKEKGKSAEVAQVKLESIDEGRCVQMLHVGPYSEESKTIAQMRDFAQAKGLTCQGHHHEIYLSDPRRVPPERLRTILRQPVSPAK